LQGFLRIGETGCEGRGWSLESRATRRDRRAARRARRRVRRRHARDDDRHRHLRRATGRRPTSACEEALVIERKTCWKPRI